jgi:hypothetical protein
MEKLMTLWKYSKRDSKMVSHEHMGTTNTYCDMYATNKMGSSSDDWIYSQLVTHSLIITRKHRQYSAMSRLHQLQFTVAHALGFPHSTSRLPAADVDANYNSLTLQVLHINLLFTEAVFSTYVDSSYLTAHTLLVLHFTTRAALPSVSPINAGI